MPMYLTLQVEPDEFRVSAMKNDGTLIDTVSIPAKHQEAKFPKTRTTPTRRPRNRRSKKISRVLSNMLRKV